nr:helix-turn-helix transcriptional regulator [Pullulanibacillus pueri]
MQRNNKEYTQAQVARLSGIERSYYTKIENGTMPSVKVAQRIAKVLNFDWTLFFVENRDKTSRKQKRPFE